MNRTDGGGNRWTPLEVISGTESKAVTGPSSPLVPLSDSSSPRAANSRLPAFSSPPRPISRLPSTSLILPLLAPTVR